MSSNTLTSRQFLKYAEEAGIYLPPRLFKTNINRSAPKAKLKFKDGEWWCEFQNTISDGATPKLAYFSCMSNYHEGLECYFQRLWTKESINNKWTKAYAI